MHAYLERIIDVLGTMDRTQGKAIAQAAGRMADSIASGRAVFCLEAATRFFRSWIFSRAMDHSPDLSPLLIPA